MQHTDFDSAQRALEELRRRKCSWLIAQKLEEDIRKLTGSNLKAIGTSNIELRLLVVAADVRRMKDRMDFIRQVYRERNGKQRAKGMVASIRHRLEDYRLFPEDIGTTREELIKLGDDQFFVDHYLSLLDRN